MIRYYRFADRIIAIKGLSDHMPDGEYLEPFSCRQSLPDMEIDVQQKYIECPLFSDEMNGCRYFERNGKHYSVHEFGHVLTAVTAALEDWKENVVTVTVNPEICGESIFTVNQLLSLSGFSSGLLYRGCAAFHCSYILVKNRAVLFAGFSGQGKSTQAELWRRFRGAELINGDRALIFQRRDGWYAGGISTCGSSKVCRNYTSKIAAIILLEKGKENVLYPMKQIEKYRALLTGMAFQRRSRKETETASRLTMDIISEVPMYRLYNRADEESVEVLEKEIGGTLYDI